MSVLLIKLLYLWQSFYLPTCVRQFEKKMSPVRHKSSKGNIFEVPEPERITLYDILKVNLKNANRTSFIHRIIYAGEHTYAESEIIAIFEMIVKTVNEEYCAEKLSGFLLVYSTYFVHMVEADEHTIIKHLRYFLKNEGHMKKIGRTILLTHITHINQRFSNEWYNYSCVPPALLDKIDPKSDLETSGRHILNCVKKIYGLVNRYCMEFERGNSVVESLNATVSFVEVNELRASKKQIFGTQRDPYSKYLPEYLLLDFLMNTPYVISLADYYSYYGEIKQEPSVPDVVWPVRPEFIPFYIFDKPVNPITDLQIDQMDEVEEVVEEIDEDFEI